MAPTSRKEIDMQTAIKYQDGQNQETVAAGIDCNPGITEFCDDIFGRLNELLGDTNAKS